MNAAPKHHLHLDIETLTPVDDGPSIIDRLFELSESEALDNAPDGPDPAITRQLEKKLAAQIRARILAPADSHSR